LQAARIKFTKTEYISCPGCGRTLYNLEETIAKIRAAVSQRAKTDKRFTTLKIGIMGCIVNGPGEMADADYGYVGAGVGKVSLYKQKQCIEKNIPESDAVERLIRFIEEDLNS
jgi:(E)-4-hydroxy-3-methylbut-2-enyl-diphosphate synthase